MSALAVEERPWWVDPVEDPAVSKRPCGCPHSTGLTYVECVRATWPDADTMTDAEVAAIVRSDERWWNRPGRERTPATAVERKPRPAPRPAAYWRERLASIDAQMAAVGDSATLPDVAAARGLALGARRTARHQARVDAALQRYTRLAAKRRGYAAKLASAEAREARP